MAMRSALGLLALVLFSGCNTGADAPVLGLPERSSDAPGGSEIARGLHALELDEREERIYDEIARGNVPTWQRDLERVEITGEIDGRERRVTFWVTPDYLAVGSDDDHLLVSLSPQTAQRVADLVDAALPTPRMVDAVWNSADARLTPIRIPPDELMKSVRYMERHHRLIMAQRNLHEVPAGAFVAGHKKDVVLSAELATSPGRVAIYGWHLPDGQPIQPVTTVVADSIVPYNHGIRLVHREVFVDGVRRDIAEVLRDPELASLLNDRGLIQEARYPLSRGEG